MEDNEYECHLCKGVFQKGLTEGEAEEQLDEEFPGVDKEDCELVCGDCFKAMDDGEDRAIVGEKETHPGMMKILMGIVMHMKFTDDLGRWFALHDLFGFLDNTAEMEIILYGRKPREGEYHINGLYGESMIDKEFDKFTAKKEE